MSAALRSRVCFTISMEILWKSSSTGKPIWRYPTIPLLASAEGIKGFIRERLNGELSEQVNAVNRVWDEFESEQTTLNNLLKYTSLN